MQLKLNSQDKKEGSLLRTMFNTVVSIINT